MLDLIDVKRTLITIDAAGTQTEIAEKIVSKGGDYLLSVKANQPTLYNSMIEHFEGVGQLYNKLEFAESEDHGHGPTSFVICHAASGMSEIATKQSARSGRTTTNSVTTSLAVARISKHNNISDPYRIPSATMRRIRNSP